MSGVLFVTDPLAGLQPDVDASIGLMAATQDLGADVWACEPEDLAVVGGRVTARARRIRAGAAPPRRRPPLGRRLPVARRRSRSGRSTWPPTST